MGRLEGRNWILFYFYFRTHQAKPVHMQLLLLSSDSFIPLREIYLIECQQVSWLHDFT